MKINSQQDLSQIYDLAWGLGVLIKKWKLLLTVLFLSFILSFIYLSLTKKIWESSAIVTLAEYQDLVELRPNIMMEDKLNREAIDNFLDPEKIYIRYINLFKSRDLQADFISQHADILKLEDKKKNSRSVQKQLKNFSASLINRKNLFVHQLKFRSDTAQIANNLFQKYSKKINDKIKQSTLLSISAYMEQLRKELESQKKALVKYAELSLKHEIKKSDMASQIAKKAQIEKPLQEVGSKFLFPIDLGRPALEAQTALMKTISDPSVFHDKIIKIQSQINSFNDAKILNHQDFQAVRFIDEPGFPLKPSHPRPVFITFFIVLFFQVFAASLLLFKQIYLPSK